MKLRKDDQVWNDLLPSQTSENAYLGMETMAAAALHWKHQLWNQVAEAVEAGSYQASPE